MSKMSMIRKALMAIMVALISLMAVSCVDGKKADFKKKFVVMKKNMILPKEVGPGLFLTAIDLDEADWMIEYYYDSEAIMAELAIKNYESDGGMARYLSKIGGNNVKELIDYGLGIKMVYSTIDGDQPYNYTITNERLKDVWQKLEKGELKPMTFLETTAQEFSNVEFPTAIDEYLDIMNMSVNGNVINYDYQFRIEIDPDAFTDELKENQRQDVIDGTRTIIESNIEDIRKENVVFVYNYYSLDGNLLNSITLTANDYE